MKRVLVVAIATAFVLSLIPLTASAEPPFEVDKYRPVPAFDVELAKMTTAQGRPITPPGQNKKKDSSEGAATGILGESVQGDKYAIVVGISDYPGSGADLSYMDEDANDIITALTTIYGFSSENIFDLIDADGTEAAGGALVATRANILQAIEDVGALAGADDEVVFFFSGHGGNGRASDGDKERIDECIWAHDGAASLVPIWDGELAAEFSSYATSRIVFIFDSCYAGGMTDLEADGRVLLMATTERTLGYESSMWENGEFTYYLVDQGMLAGQANIHDYDGDDVLLESEQVTVEEAWDYAKANCSYDRPTIVDSFGNDLLP